MQECGISDGCILYLGFEITVQSLSGQVITLAVDGSDFIENVKMQVNLHLPTIRVCDMVLSFGTVELSDFATLDMYDIRHGDVVGLAVSCGDCRLGLYCARCAVQDTALDAD